MPKPVIRGAYGYPGPSTIHQDNITSKPSTSVSSSNASTSSSASSTFQKPRSLIPVPITHNTTKSFPSRATKALPRPTTWFNNTNNSPAKAALLFPSQTHPQAQQHQNQSIIGKTPKQRLCDDDDDFIMVSVSPTSAMKPRDVNRLAGRRQSGGGAGLGLGIGGIETGRGTDQIGEESPTKPCAVSMATQRLSLMETDDSPEKSGSAASSSSNGGIAESPIRQVLGQSRSLGLGKAVLGRTSSGIEGSSPDSVRQKQGSWIKRSKVSNFSDPNSSGLGGLKGKKSIGSLPPMTPGPVKGIFGTGAGENSPGEEDEVLAGSSSPPPPDTPVQRSAGSGFGAGGGGVGVGGGRLGEYRRGSLGNGIAQPRFGTLKTSQSHDEHRTSGFFSPKPAIATSGNTTRFSNSKSLRADGNCTPPMFGHSKKTTSLDGQSGSRLATLAGGGNGIGNIDTDSPFGSGMGIPPRARKLGSGSNASPYPQGGKPHRRTGSQEQNILASISRSHGLKSGLSDSVNSNSSAGSTRSGTIPKSISGSSRSSFESQGSVLTPEELLLFDDVKPLQAAFEPAEGPVERKFKPGRDSGIGFENPRFDTLPIINNSNSIGFVMPGSAFAGPKVLKPARPAFLKRASSCGDERSPAVTPGVDVVTSTGWPSAFGFDLPVRSSLGGGEKLTMPGTPVKRPSFGGTGGTISSTSDMSRIAQSTSQPALPTNLLFSAVKPSRQTIDTSCLPPPPPLPSFTYHTIPSPSPGQMTSHLGSSKSRISGVHLTVTTASSPISPTESEMEEPSPTIRLFGRNEFSIGNGNGNAPSLMAEMSKADVNVRRGLLRRLSSGHGTASSESEENTPTRPGTHDHQMLISESIQRATTPTPMPNTPSTSVPMLTSTLPIATPFQSSKYSAQTRHPAGRQSLPNFTLSKPLRRHLPRQSAPQANEFDQEEDIFESRFLVLEALGKGAFSQVVKVKERDGERVFAVKKARGVFEGLKDRLRHLEEVDILRHLATQPHPNVIAFIDAWEQNRQLFIVTELCLANLAQFLEDYGRVVERLDEARVWKTARELADGLHHIHSMGVIHFDIKPANILISESGSLKIGDFGHATRWPRVDAKAIMEGSGLGGEVVGSGTGQGASQRMPDREGDRVYMAPEELSGTFSMAADVFSYGLVILEASTNICVPDGGPAWHALRANDFSILDFSQLSPALIDLITSCMNSSPDLRPTTRDIASHPIIGRARLHGKAALSPEEGVNGETWLAGILTGSPVGVGSISWMMDSESGNTSMPVTPTPMHQPMMGISPDMMRISVSNGGGGDSGGGGGSADEDVEMRD